MVKPNALFTDGAVLQRDMPIPVWGTADDGESVTVTLGNQSATAQTEGGRWMVRLKPMDAGGPYALTVSGSNKVEVKDIYIGEVWLCSGQSNMEWPMCETDGGPEEIARAKDAKLRLFVVPHAPKREPQTDTKAAWQVCSPDTTKWFSAVGYYFGKMLRDKLDVPVGLIESAWGGTLVEAWTSYRCLDDYDKKRYADKVGYRGDEEQHFPSYLYNGMIAPLAPYAMRGVIWYQGESNAGLARAYRKRFPAMINNWREDWGQGDFPFLFVQLAPFGKVVDTPGDSAWAELREAQLLTAMNVLNTGMAVTMDIGNPNDIHPRNKKTVGERLASIARAKVYGEDVLYRGPVFRSMDVKGDRAVLSFHFADCGLAAKGGELTGFAVAGEDRAFRNAVATIQGDKVVVHCDAVDKPVAVRYGWADAPVANLFNNSGFPATPFRTDDFPLTTPDH